MFLEKRCVFCFSGAQRLRWENWHPWNNCIFTDSPEALDLSNQSGVIWGPGVQIKLCELGDGFKYVLFWPRSLGRWSNLTSIFFLDGLVQPPTIVNIVEKVQNFLPSWESKGAQTPCTYSQETLNRKPSLEKKLSEAWLWHQHLSPGKLSDLERLCK